MTSIISSVSKMCAYIIRYIYYAGIILLYVPTVLSLLSALFKLLVRENLGHHCSLSYGVFNWKWTQEETLNSSTARCIIFIKLMNFAREWCGAVGGGGGWRQWIQGLEPSLCHSFLCVIDREPQRAVWKSNLFQFWENLIRIQKAKCTSMFLCLWIVTIIL